MAGSLNIRDNIIDTGTEHFVRGSHSQLAGF